MNASYLDIITAGNKHTAMLQTNGIEQGRAVQMSRDLITVGIDAAAVLGNQEETHRRMKGVITGETEAIEELGINLKVSALAQQAFKEISEKSELGQLLLSKGISGTTADIAKQIPTMDEATKIQLRHGTAMEQSRIFAGASAEMQDTLGGKVQTLKNR